MGASASLSVRGVLFVNITCVVRCFGVEWPRPRKDLLRRNCERASKQCSIPLYMIALGSPRGSIAITSACRVPAGILLYSEVRRSILKKSRSPSFAQIGLATHNDFHGNLMASSLYPLLAREPLQHQYYITDIYVVIDVRPYDSS